MKFIVLNDRVMDYFENCDFIHLSKSIKMAFQTRSNYKVNCKFVNSKIY